MTVFRRCFLLSLGLVISVLEAVQSQISARPATSCLDAAVWTQKASEQIAERRQIPDAALSSDGSVLVVSIEDGVMSRLVAYDVLSRQILWDHPQDDAPSHVVIAADDSEVVASTFVTCRKSSSLQRWELRTGAELPAPAADGEFDGQMWPSAIALGGQYIAAAEAIVGDIQVWSVKTGQTVKVITTDGRWTIEHAGLGAIAMDGQGKLLAGGGMGRAFVWSCPSGKQLPSYTHFPKDEAVIALAFNRDGSRLAASTFYNTQILDASNGRVLRTFTGQWLRLSFLEDGSLLLVGTDKYGVWEKGKELQVKKLPPDVHSVFDARGNVYTLSATETGVQLVGAADGRAVEFSFPAR